LVGLARANHHNIQPLALQHFKVSGVPARRASARHGACAAFLRNDVKVRDEHVGPPLPDGSFKVADPDGNVVDVTGNPAEWRQ